MPSNAVGDLKWHMPLASELLVLFYIVFYKHTVPAGIELGTVITNASRRGPPKKRRSGKPVTPVFTKQSDPSHGKTKAHSGETECALQTTCRGPASADPGGPQLMRREAKTSMVFRLT